MTPLLPQYQRVPTSEMDEKAPIKLGLHRKDEDDADFDPRIHHPASIGLWKVDEKAIVKLGLHDGTEFNPRIHHPASIGLLNRPTARIGTSAVGVKSKLRGLSGMKKALLALAVVWFTFIIARKAGHSRDREVAGVFVPWRDFASPAYHVHDGLRTPFRGCDNSLHIESELESVPTIYGSSMTIGGSHAANASFTVPLSADGRPLNIAFEGLDGEVVISRSDRVAEEGTSPQAEVIVESTYAADIVPQEGAVMQSGHSADRLTLSPHPDVQSHKVYLVVPASVSTIPSLSLKSTKALNLVLADTALDLTFGHLSLRSDLGDVTFPEERVVQAHEVEIATIGGTVGGTYNISRALVIRTLTGDINAKVHVLPPWQGPSKRPPPHGDPDRGEPHGKPPHREHDEGHHHERAHKHEKKNKKHEKKHKKHEKKHKKHENKHGHHREHEHEHEHGHHKSSLFSLASFFSKKHDNGPHPPPPPPPPPGPHSPPPVFVGVFSTTGAVNLSILSQNVWTSSEIKAFTKVANVSVVHSETFRGTYELGSFKGNYTVTIPKKEAYKDHTIVDQGVTETGGWQVGIVGYKRPEGEKPPTVPDTPDKGPGDPPRPGPGVPPPGSPGGPEDRPPPPKGHSRVFAHTDVGNVDITL